MTASGDKQDQARLLCSWLLAFRLEGAAHHNESLFMQHGTELVQHLITHSLHEVEVDGVVRLCLNTALTVSYSCCRLTSVMSSQMVAWG